MVIGSKFPFLPPTGATASASRSPMNAWDADVICSRQLLTPLQWPLMAQRVHWSRESKKSRMKEKVRPDDPMSGDDRRRTFPSVRLIRLYLVNDSSDQSLLCPVWVYRKCRLSWVYCCEQFNMCVHCTRGSGQWYLTWVPSERLSAVSWKWLVNSRPSDEWRCESALGELPGEPAKGEPATRKVAS